MKTAKIIFFTVFGILFSFTAVGLVYAAITFLSAALEDKMLIVFAPMFLLIYILPLLIAEAELFFFFRWLWIFLSFQTSTSSYFQSAI